MNRISEQLSSGGSTPSLSDLGLTAIKNLKEFTGVLRFLPEGVALSGRLEIQ